MVANAWFERMGCGCMSDGCDVQWMSDEWWSE